MPNTGYKGYTNLEQYFLDNGTATGFIKPNDVSDPDYIAPVYDPIFCPPPSPSVTSTPTVTVTPTITPTTTPTVTPTATVSLSPVAISPTPTITVTTTVTVTPTVTKTPTVTPTKTPTPTVTPTITPSTSVPTQYVWLGRTTPDANSDTNACNTYTSTRQYITTVPYLAAGVRVYDSYPSSPTNGGNNWVALRYNGVGTKYAVQIDSSGYITGNGASIC